MKLFVATATFFAALACFRVCHAQDDPLTAVTSLPEYETTIWTEGLEPISTTTPEIIDHFSMRPIRSAALISRNLLLAVEGVTATNAQANLAAVVLKTNLYTTTSFFDFRQLTRVNIPVLESDPPTRLVIYKVTPAFDAADSRLKPIQISANRTRADERCTISLWKTDSRLYSALRAVTNNTVCPNSTDSYFCVSRPLTDTDLMPLDGGLIVCNGQLAGLHSIQITADQRARFFLWLGPFRERLERIILDNPPPLPTTPATTPATTPIPSHSPKATASAVLCLVFAGFLATSGVL